MRSYRTFLFCAGLAWTILSGCSDVDTDPAPSSLQQNTSVAVDADSLVTLLQEADTTALSEAFDARPDKNYFRRSRTRQVDPQTNTTLASYEALIRHVPGEGGGIELVKADSVGSFMLGVLSSFMRPARQVGMLPNPMPYLLTDTTYLSNRGRGLYEYALLADTSIAGRPAAVVAVSLRPGAGEDQQVRSGRFYIDKSTTALVGVSLRRRQQALLFSEESTLEVYIRKAGPEGWFPDRTRYQTTLDIPFMTPKYLVTEAHYFTETPDG